MTCSLVFNLTHCITCTTALHGCRQRRRRCRCRRHGCRRLVVVDVDVALDVVVVVVVVADVVVDVIDVVVDVVVVVVVVVAVVDRWYRGSSIVVVDVASTWSSYVICECYSVFGCIVYSTIA